MLLLSDYANPCECLKSFSEHLQPLCCPIFPRNSDVFVLWLCFQMANRVHNQVVRLTRCLNVPGHTAMLVRVMIETGYRWYPEYTVEEQFRDFNQSQYFCTVRIFPSYPGSTEPLHCSYGLGVTAEMAVQDAAYSMMTILRVRTGLLRNTDFRNMPASLPGAQGYLQAIFADST